MALASEISDRLTCSTSPVTGAVGLSGHPVCQMSTDVNCHCPWIVLRPSVEAYKDCLVLRRPCWARLSVVNGRMR